MDTKFFKKYKLVAEMIERYKGDKITSPGAAAEFLRPLYGDQLNVLEMFYVVFMDSQKTPLGYQLIGRGGRVSAVVDTMLIFKGAVEAVAHSVVLSHNHPSGQLKPSHADINITKKIAAGLQTLEIEVDDHLILTETDFYSFRGGAESSALSGR